MKKLTFAFIFAALAFTAAAQAETTNCTAIITLPYTISTQGVYCLTAHVSTGITTGYAITINTNNVVLDLNGFKIGGLGAGLGTQAKGIYAHQRQNITIKNGTVRGFLYGIFLDDSTPYTTSQGHVIEDIRADQNTYIGIFINGNGNIIRNNQVVATGGSTLLAYTAAHGIVAYGPGSRLLNNDVTDVAAQGTSWAFGIDLYVGSGSSSVVAGNRVDNVTSPGGSTGISLTGSGDNSVKDNIVSGSQYGIYFASPATGVYMNNLVRGATFPYTSGTPAGTTNYP